MIKNMLKYRIHTFGSAKAKGLSIPLSARNSNERHRAIYGAFFIFRSPVGLALTLDRGANEGNDTGIQRLKLPTRGFGIGENPRAKDGRGADRWLDTDKEPSIS